MLKPYLQNVFFLKYLLIRYALNHDWKSLFVYVSYCIEFFSEDVIVLLNQYQNNISIMCHIIVMQTGRPIESLWYHGFALTHYGVVFIIWF